MNYLRAFAALLNITANVMSPIVLNVPRTVIDRSEIIAVVITKLQDTRRIIYDGTHLSQNFMSAAIFPEVNNSRNVSFLKREYVYFKKELCKLYQDLPRFLVIFLVIFLFNF